MNHYTILKSVGSGATSECFEVEDLRNNRHYIMKQMSTIGMTDQERTRAKLEIAVLQKIDHPNIVRYRESFIAGEHMCIVMERCATSLGDIIDQKREAMERRAESSGQPSSSSSISSSDSSSSAPFSTSLLLEWTAELLCGIQYLHQKNIIHRDLKPSNVFVTDSNHLKIGDFGICKILGNGSASGTITRDTLSLQSCGGVIVGTPMYLAPELFEAAVYSQATDMWALGAVLYEMCALQPPFQAGNMFALMAMIMNNAVAPLKKSIDSRFAQMVELLLNKDPSKRPSAQQVMTQFINLPTNHPSHPSQHPQAGRVLQRLHHLPLNRSNDCEEAAPCDTHSADSSNVNDVSNQSDDRDTVSRSAPPRDADEGKPSKSKSSNDSNSGVEPASTTSESSKRQQGDGKGVQEFRMMVKQKCSSSSSDGEFDSPPISYAGNRADRLQHDDDDGGGHHEDERRGVAPPSGVAVPLQLFRPTMVPAAIAAKGMSPTPLAVAKKKKAIPPGCSNVPTASSAARGKAIEMQRRVGGIANVPLSPVGTPSKAAVVAPSPASTSTSAGGAPTTSPQGHEDALRRIKSAKSKINMDELRRQMKERKTQLLSDVGFLGGVLVPSSSSPPREMSSPSHDPSVGSSPPSVAGNYRDPSLDVFTHASVASIPPTLLLTTNDSDKKAPSVRTTIAEEVMSTLTAWDAQHEVSLEDLDEIAMLLNQFKLRKFGVY